MLEKHGFDLTLVSDLKAGDLFFWTNDSRILTSPFNVNRFLLFQILYQNIKQYILENWCSEILIKAKSLNTQF